MTSITELVPVAATTVALYLTLLVFVRLAGRRTVSQLSAFDALVTIALGSVFATSVVSDPPSYARGVVAVVTLLALQLAVGTLRQRAPFVRRLVDFPPRTILQDGRLQLECGPLGPQLTENEVDRALRRAGFEDRSLIATIVLESDGQMSVIPHARPGGRVRL